jgi:hypothetical protein
MSTEAYLRVNSRDTRIWKPYAYSFPFNAVQTTERGIVYGLYSTSNLNQNKYLQEIEAGELANLLSDYNSKIAALTNQEQLVVADIVSKRYLSSIEKLIHDEKMVTKSAQITAEDAEWDAKIAALSADQAALETMAVKVTSETEKTAARISELEAYIAIEGMNLSEVDIEIAEKAIQLAKVDIQKLDTSNAVLKIQIDTVQAAQELVDIDLKIARTKIDVAETTRSINKIGLLDSELTIEQAKTEIAEAELGVSASKVTLAEAKTDEVDAEIDYTRGTLTQQAATDYSGKVDLMDVKQSGREDALTMRRQEKDLELDNKVALSGLDITFANNDKTLQSSIDSAHVSVMDTKVANEWTKIQAAVEVQKTLAAAKITTTLTHAVKKKV